MKPFAISVSQHDNGMFITVQRLVSHRHYPIASTKHYERIAEIVQDNPCEIFINQVCVGWDAYYPSLSEWIEARDEAVSNPEDDPDEAYERWGNEEGLCPHGLEPHECSSCMVTSDLAYDSYRETSRW